jgi:acyl-CoA dehydrogenase
VLAVLRRLLRDAPEPIAADRVGDWWARVSERCLDLTESADRAIVSGSLADRVGYALAGGYEAALRVIAPFLSHDAIASFCATEQGGNRPRAIETRLAPVAGGFTVTGAKRWSTMGPLASVLLVVASEGADESGRNRLRLVRVDAASPGVTIGSMPVTAVAPEVPHGTIELDDVVVDATALLPGDGYADYVKPYRTIEDIHIHGAVLGYLMAVSRRYRFAQEAIERLTVSVAATRALAAIDPAAPETHVALAGLLAADARLVSDLAPSWAGVSGPERDRWERDHRLFGSPRNVHEQRRQRAWEAIGRS